MPAFETSWSSPLAWGTQWPVSPQPHQPRFIPTRVGNTRNRAAPRCVPPVHPHSRGERFWLYAHKCSYTGSSPLAWGTRDGAGWHPGRDRFIPTRVGNTRPATGCRQTRTVHPHSHGEHAIYPGRRREKCGSSPLAWGTPQCDLIENNRSRFIPTRMGNTSARAGATVVCLVHPHSHGEHAAQVGLGAAAGGSSPLAWGTHHFQSTDF